MFVNAVQTEKANDAHHHHHRQHQGFQPANFTTGTTIKDDLSERKHQHLRFMTDLFPRQHGRVAPKRQVGGMPAQQQHGFQRAGENGGKATSAFGDAAVIENVAAAVSKPPAALRMFNQQTQQLQKPLALKPQQQQQRFNGVLRSAATGQQQQQQQYNGANENWKPLQPAPVLANDLKNACHFADLKARRGALKAVAGSPTVSKSSSLLFERQLIEDDDPFAGPPMAGFEDEEVFQIDL